MPETPGYAPFMQCEKCRRHASTWVHQNGAWECPCGGGEETLSMLDPHSLIGTWWRLRRGRVRILDYLGGNTFRVIDRLDITRTVSILSMTEEQ